VIVIVAYLISFQMSQIIKAHRILFFAQFSPMKLLQKCPF